MTTFFWLNEKNPRCRLNIWGDKIKNASQYPKYWEGDEIVDNPLYAAGYLHFFDITHRVKPTKWGKSFSWVISREGEEIMTRNAGHYDNTSHGGYKTTSVRFDIDDGILPRVESSIQREFHASLMEGGFSLQEINKLRTALGLPQVVDFVKY